MIVKCWQGHTQEHSKILTSGIHLYKCRWFTINKKIPINNLTKQLSKIYFHYILPICLEYINTKKMGI